MYRQLFAAHLDLTPLKERARGLVPCPWHRDPRPSLSVDLERGLFHCFGCGAQGGPLTFATRVGEARANLVDGHPTTHEPESAWDIAVDLAEHQRWNDDALLDLYNISDWIRHTRRSVAATRRAARDTDDGWSQLLVAAQRERLADAAEAEIDEVLTGGRVA